MNDQQTLLQQMRQFQEHLKKGFELTPEFEDIQVGMTPKTQIHADNKLKLYRYQALTDQESKHDPILIVYALVNRPYIVDLYEERSLVQGLLRNQIDVYLIDWGYPSAADRYLDLSDYVEGYIERCVNEVLRDSKKSKLNLLGICQGGTMSLCYSALHPEKVGGLITMVTPVDFQTNDNILSLWFREIDVDLLVDARGNIPGVLLNSMFLSLKPFQLGLQKYLDFVKIADQPEKVKNFMRMEKWIFDSPDQAGAMFRTFIKAFYHQNCLVRGGLELNHQKVHLRALNLPVLNIMAKHDHLVPPSASRSLKYLIGSADYKELEYDTGHIGIYVSSKAGADIPSQIANWLSQRC